MTDKTFAGLGLPAALTSALENAGFVTPTPIQAKAIPAQLAGNDILGIAQTGSGKTAAFCLPIIAALMDAQPNRESKTASALILAPTRELAVQIEEMVRLYTPGRRLTTALVLGGVSRHAQIQKMAKGVDILIATPGRLEDLMNDRKVRLDKTKFFVLDEADRMLDMGFIKPVRTIAAAIGRDRRTALFSATMATDVAKLAATLLNDPVRVEASPQGTTVATIDQRVILAPSKQKREELNGLLADESLAKVIVFTRTKHGADKVAKNLGIDGHTVGAIHGNKSQNARQSALKGFRSGRIRVLVATDIAARGIDVPEIDMVINYELPDDAENYVHRIGRTGRNGASGQAVTLVDGTERGKLRDVERIIRRTLPYTGEIPRGAQNAPSEGRPARGRGRGGPPGAGGKPRFGEKRSFQKRGDRPRGDKARDDRPRAEASGKNWRPETSATEPKVVDRAAQPTEGKRKPFNGQRKAEGQAKPAHDQHKPGKGKKPRWNKRKKDTARVARAAGDAPRKRPSAA